MKKINIHTFLIILFAASSLLTLFIIVMVYVRISTLSNARVFANQYNNFFFEWNDAQKSQFNFLVKYKDDQVFFQTEQNKFLKHYQLSSSNSLLKIDSISLNRLTNKLELFDDFQLYKENISNIDQTFSEISHLLFLRGSKNTGLIGNINSFYNTAITSVTDETYKSILTAMNDEFLNYLNEPNIDYYNQYLTYFSTLSEIISTTPFVRDSSLTDSMQVLVAKNPAMVDFVDNLNNYKQSFSKLVNIDRKLFLNEQDNLLKNLFDADDNFEESLLNNQTIIEQYLQNIQKTGNTIILVLFILLFTIGVLLVIIAPPTLSRRLDEFKNYIEPLKYGQIPNLDYKPKYFTDITEIFFTIQNFVNSLNKASEFASEIGNRNFTFDFKPISNQDDLGNALILLRDNIKKSQEEEIKRKKEDEIRLWVNTGIAKFSDLLRQTSNLEQLSALIIKEVVNYLNANQGGIFVLNDQRKDNIYLELMASYAYSKERKKRKIFYLGEGLVGTCAVEKSSIYMTDIPEDYISITSGLGGASPRSLLLTPLKYEENVLGVIEIASFDIIEKYQIEFVERIAESFASTISIAKINEQTVKLLETAKIEAEQRSLKEEELRQNLEELSATQERAAVQQQELDKLVDIISEVSYIVDLDINGNFINVPEKIIKSFNMTINDFLGHNIAEFDSNPDSILSSLDFWQNLFDGNKQKIVYYFKTKEGDFWYNLNINPWYDNSGEITKFVAIFADITEQKKLENELSESLQSQKNKEQQILSNIEELERANNLVIKEKQNLQSTLEKLNLAHDTLDQQNKKNKDHIEKVEKIIKNTDKQLKNIIKLFTNSTDSFQVLANNKFVECNQATLEVFGYQTKEEFLNTHPGEVSPETQPDGSNSIEKSNEHIKKAVEEGFDDFEWVHKRKDGTLFNCIVTLTSFVIEEVVYVYALIKPTE